MNTRLEYLSSVSEEDVPAFQCSSTESAKQCNYVSWSIMITATVITIKKPNNWYRQCMSEGYPSCPPPDAAHAVVTCCISKSSSESVVCPIGAI